MQTMWIVMLTVFALALVIENEASVLKRQDAPPASSQDSGSTTLGKVAYAGGKLTGKVLAPVVDTLDYTLTGLLKGFWNIGFGLGKGLYEIGNGVAGGLVDIGKGTSQGTGALATGVAKDLSDLANAGKDAGYMAGDAAVKAGTALANAGKTAGEAIKNQLSDAAVQTVNGLKAGGLGD